MEAKGYALKTITLPGTDGQCGAAAGIATHTITNNKIDLCNPGDPSVVIANGQWTWVCFGPHGGAKVSCSAPMQ
jgi:hypothetical protein